MKPASGHDVRPLIAALERGDDVATRAEGERALADGLTPTATSVDEAIALALWREGRDRGRSGFDGWPGTPALVDHLRACADRGARWAMAWLGLEQFLTWTARDEHPTVPSLTDDERERHLRRAAALGHRRAAFVLGLKLDSDQDALDFVTHAFADGEPDPESEHGSSNATGWRQADAYPMTRDHLGDAALEGAHRAASLGRHDEARMWFTRCAFRTEWESDETSRTRSGARRSFAQWSEQQGRSDEAQTLWQMLVDEAARDSLVDARWMRSEWKTYRDDWQFCRDRESARHDALVSMWDVESRWRTEEIALLLADNYFVGAADEPVLREYLRSTPGQDSFLAQMRHAVLGRTGQGASNGEPSPEADRQAAVAVLWWVARDFQSGVLEALGMPDEASKFRAALDEVSPNSAPSTVDGDGGLGVLTPVDRLPSARAIVSTHRPAPPASSQGVRRRPDRPIGWMTSLHLTGTDRFRQGRESTIPPLRGTPLGVALWLAGGQHLEEWLDELRYEIDQLMLEAERTLAQTAAGPDDDGSTAALEILRRHLREQRTAFESFVAGL